MREGFASTRTSCLDNRSQLPVPRCAQLVRHRLRDFVERALQKHTPSPCLDRWWARHAHFLLHAAPHQLDQLRIRASHRELTTLVSLESGLHNTQYCGLPARVVVCHRGPFRPERGAENAFPGSISGTPQCIRTILFFECMFDEAYANMPDAGLDCHAQVASNSPVVPVASFLGSDQAPIWSEHDGLGHFLPIFHAVRGAWAKQNQSFCTVRLQNTKISVAHI